MAERGAASKPVLGEEPLRSDGPVRGREEGAPESMGAAERFMESARKRIAQAHDFWLPLMEMADKDLEFIYGDQWEASDLARRRSQQRPALTLNLLQANVAQVRGAALSTQFSINVVQRGGVLSSIEKASGASLSMPEILEGMIRDVEQRSRARHAYATALQHSVEGGFGFLRVRIERDPADPFSMQARIRAVHDRFSVWFDPHAREDDLSDARWVAVSRPMPREEFKALWPGADADGWSFAGQESSFSEQYARWWRPSGEVRVVDWYEKVPARRVAVRLERPSGPGLGAESMTLFEDDAEGVLDELLGPEWGFRETGRAEVDSHRVEMRRITSKETLEGPRRWPCMDLPVVPVLGRRVDTRSKRLFIGAARYSKDAQRMHNYYASAATERVSQSIRAKVLIGMSQLTGGDLESEWENAHASPQMFLKYDDTSDGPPPAVISAPDMPGAELAMMQVGTQAVRDTSGIHEAELGKPSNERSGRAILQRQEAGRSMYAEYVDHLGYAVGRIGQMLCEIIPQLRSSDELVRLVLPGGSSETARINHKVVDEETGETRIVAPLGLARFECFAEAGPLHHSQQDKFLALMTEWGKSDPQALQAARDLMVQMMNLPGKQEIARRFRMLMPREMLSEEDRARLPEPPPDPAAEAARMEAQARMMEAQSRIEDAKARQIKARADPGMQEDRLRQSGLKVEQEALKTLRERDANREEAAPSSPADVERLVREAVAKELARRG